MPVVVKLGGSVANNLERLSLVLSLLGSGRGQVVVVPGGGVFADAVRAQQTSMGFSDDCAHTLAILGMHQTGLMIADIEECLVCVETLEEIAQVWDSGQVPVWLPLKLIDQDMGLARDWSVTSDAIAARLAVWLGAERVVLIKSCAVPSDTPVEQLASEGVVDPVFAQIVSDARLSYAVVGPGDEARLSEFINADTSARRSDGGVLERD